MSLPALSFDILYHIMGMLEESVANIAVLDKFTTVVRAAGRLDRLGDLLMRCHTYASLFYGPKVYEIISEHKIVLGFVKKVHIGYAAGVPGWEHAQEQPFHTQQLIELLSTLRTVRHLVIVVPNSINVWNTQSAVYERATLALSDLASVSLIFNNCHHGTATTNPLLRLLKQASNVTMRLSGRFNFCDESLRELAAPVKMSNLTYFELRANALDRDVFAPSIDQILTDTSLDKLKVLCVDSTRLIPRPPMSSTFSSLNMLAVSMVHPSAVVDINTMQHFCGLETLCLTVSQPDALGPQVLHYTAHVARTLSMQITPELLEVVVRHLELEDLPKNYYLSHLILMGDDTNRPHQEYQAGVASLAAALARYEITIQDQTHQHNLPI